MDKRISLLDIEATGNILHSRVDDASTPNRGPSADRITDFMKREEALRFSTDGGFYHNIIEEKDDTMLHWYPMYLHYAKEKRAKAVATQLQRQGYEYYIHSPFVLRNAYGEPVDEDHSIYNIVFVQAMKIQLKLLKRFNHECRHMKFMTVQPTDQQHRQIIWIPDQQMANFIEAATRPDPDSQRRLLTWNDFIDKQGRRVRVIGGAFKGIEGEVKRINRHRIVVAMLQQVNQAIGLTHIPPQDLLFLD